MKANLDILFLVLIVLIVNSCGQHKQPNVGEKISDQSALKSFSNASETASASAAASLKPKNGFVPDEQTAITIAIAVWTPIYGKEHIENEKPYNAGLKNGVWTVTGTLPEGYDGGTAMAEISQEDGCILKIIHYK